MAARSNSLVTNQIADSGAFGRSLVQSAAASDARTLLAIPATANTWTAQQSIQINELASFNIWQRVLPTATDTQSNPFNFTAASADFDGTKDFVVRFGHNLSAGGAAVDATRAILGTEYEQNYDPGDGQTYAEGHVLVHQRPGGPIRRIISTYLSNTNAPSVTNHLLNFTAQRLAHFSADDAAPVPIWTSDSTNGLLVTNAPLGTVHTNVATNHLVLAGPTAQTGRYLACTKNGSILAELTAYGELALYGNISGSGGTGIPMLGVRGRTAASGGGDVAQFYDSSGGNRLRIVEGTSDSTLILSRGRWQHSGGSFEKFNAAGSTKVFEIQVDGAIRTNQTSAGGPAGALVAKMPIYDTSLNLIGYIPINALS